MKNEKEISLIKRYEKDVRQLKYEAQNNTNKEAAHEAFRKINIYKDIGKLYIQMTLRKFSTNLGNQDFNKLYSHLQRYFKTNELSIELLLGYSMDRELASIPGYSEIQSQVKYALFQTERKSQSTNIFFDSDSEEQTYYDQTKQKIKYIQKKQQPVLFKAAVLQQNEGLDSDEELTVTMVSKDEISLDLDEEIDFDSDLIPKQSQQIKQYLLKLSKATTQLSYLCQHMKWVQPTFSETRSEVNDSIFQAKVTVIVRSKNKVIEITGLCSGAISKKEARRVASLFVLRKIYNRFPEVWEKFKLIRSLNEGKQQPLNVNNEEIFNKAKLNMIEFSNFFNQEADVSDKKEDADLENYLDKVKSYKNQINLLIGKVKKLTPPSMIRDVQDDLGLWPVKAEMYYEGTCFQSKAKEQNKKKAEEKCCRQLLFQFYKQYPEKWTDFKNYKQLKSL